MAKRALGVLLVSFLGIAAGEQSQEKPAPPSSAEEAQAEKLIKETFKEEYALRTPAGQRKLAQKLLQQGKDTKDSESVRYVLFREASDLGGRGGPR